jgi:GntR family transcriptional regulator, transcriptional repressor for pyruvate dehydrogenase complex
MSDRSRPATEQAVAAIMAMLTSGELGPGDRLPTERELALRLGMSRSTVREAIRGLEMMRVLDVRHGEGIFITSLEPRLLLEVTGVAMQLMRDHDVLEMFELRAILEGAAAALASARLTDDHRQTLRTRLADLEAATTVEALLEADIAFHAAIAAVTGNAVMESLLAMFAARTYRARYLNAGLDLEQALRNARAAHRHIFEAVVSRDSEAARAVASAHVHAVASWLRSVVGEHRTADRGVARPVDAYKRR